MRSKMFLPSLLLFVLIGCSSAPANTNQGNTPTDVPASTEASAAPTEVVAEAPTTEAATELPHAATEPPATTALPAATELPAATVPPAPVDVTGSTAAALTSTDGYFQLQTMLVQGEDKCFEGQGGPSPESGATLGGGAFMNICQNVSGQMWKLVILNNGYYHLQNQIGEAQNLCLEGNRVSEESILSGAAIMYPCSDVSGQQWKFVDAGNSYFRMQTMFLEKDNKCLEGQGGTAPDSGAVLLGAAFMNDCQDVSGQLWRIVPTSPTAQQRTPEAAATLEAAATPEATATPEAATSVVQEPTATMNEFEMRVVELVNQERVRVGCTTPPIAVDAILQRTAQKHSMDLAINDYFSHYGLDGSEPHNRAQREGYMAGIKIEENIGAGYDTPEKAVQGWMNSPGHRANIVNCNLTKIGVGYYYLQNDTGKVNYNHYWTQNFALK